MSPSVLFILTYVALGATPSLYESPTPIEVIADETNRSRVLIFEDGSARLFDTHRRITITEYTLKDSACRHLSALAYPFLSSLTLTCKLDETTRLIEAIGETALPDPNTFAFAFLNETPQFSYFVMNGRPWNSAGFVKLKWIRKSDNQQGIRNLLSGIPGYSGAMSHDPIDQLLYYTMATGGFSNHLYTIASRTLNHLIETETSADFREVAQHKTGPFPGLSLHLIGGTDSLVYLNGEHGSYSIRKTDGQRQTFSLPTGCNLVGTAGPKWLLLCDERKLIIHSEET